MPRELLKSPSNPLRFAWGLVRGISGLLILVIGLVVYNVGQLLSLVVLPISRRAFRAYNRLGADLWWRCFAALARGLHRVRVEIGGDDLPARENVLLVANHQQMTDICFLILLACHCRAAGDTKWFVKNAIKYVPLMGWGMLFLDNLFVKRSWAVDQASIERTFYRINRDRVPIWLILFAEGTRLTPSKLATSQRVASRKNRAPTSHVMLPRTKGFTASVRGLRDHLDAIYDVTIAYGEAGVPSLWQFICGFAKTANLHVRRIPTDELPVDERELNRWLLDRFEAKDARLETFYQGGTLGSTSRG
jgi:1-acyl-sn-glycerol-3-phosphate acyltransferase